MANLAQALRDATDSGARIINLSIQTPGYSATLDLAVQYARSHGVVLVAAAGNAPLCSLVCYPAKFDGVVAVASVTINQQPAFYSAAGTEVDIAGGGGDSAMPVLSTWSANANALSNCKEADRVERPGAWYCQRYGTSMAAPQVSAAAALLLAMRPALTADEVAAILRDTAHLLPGVAAERVGAGLLDAEAAVRKLVASELRLSQPSFNQTASVGSTPFTTTLVLTNPSLDPLTVSGALKGSGGWLAGASFGGDNFVTSIRYGHPAYLSLRLDPTGLVTGTYTGEIVLDAQRSDGTHSAVSVPIVLYVGSLNRVLHLPLLQNGATGGASPSRFVWETGSNEVGYVLGDTGRAEVQLPFSFPAAGPDVASGHTYARAIIAADGYVLFPDSPGSVPSAPAINSCLPQLSQPMQAVWGWWSDLNVGASGAEVVTFQPRADRFVIEYRNVASAAGASEPYRVTFQIVLFQNGAVQLNYLQTPAVSGQSLQQASPRATVGVQSQAGLFRNQVACITASEAGNGFLPASRQSVLINRQEVY